MHTIKKIFIISAMTLGLLFINSSHVCSRTTAPSEDFMHGLIKAVQITFERGAQFYMTGKAQKAQVLFDQCHYLLLAADEIGDEALQRRIDRVFETFYRELAGLNPDIAGAYQEIQSQVRSTFEEEPVYAGQVRYYVDYLVTNKSSFLKNSFRRAYQYLPMIRQEFAAAGIPEDLAYMALIESGFRPDPVSHAGAKGLWQFMPATAERFGMRVHGGIDERTDPLKSTRAAAQYLTVLYGMFDNWPLAVAAYNCGEGRVRRALDSSGSSTYWELVEKKALPLETQRFVPSIIAATLIARDPGAYGIMMD